MTEVFVDEIVKLNKALTAQQVAHLLALPVLSVYRKAKAGIIPSFRIGTSVRFDPSAIAAMVQNA